MRIRVLAFLAVMVAVATAPASASALADFKTPGNAAICGTDHYLGNTFTCWTPNDGFQVWLSLGNRAPSHRYERSAVGYIDYVGKILRFEQNWASHRPAISGFRCKSERTGLTCVNPQRHGFWLGRYHGFRDW